MRVFISYSHEDAPAVDAVAKELRQNGMEPVLAAEEPPSSLPQALSDKVAELILGCDLVLAVITVSSVTSVWVQQEIGFAKDQKPLVPLVEAGVPTDRLGFLGGVEYIPFNRQDIVTSIKKLQQWAEKLRRKKAQAKPRGVSPEAIILVALLAVAALAAAFLVGREVGRAAVPRSPDGPP